MTGTFIDYTRDTKCVFCPSNRFELQSWINAKDSKIYRFVRKCLDCSQSLIITNDDFYYLIKIHDIEEDDLKIKIINL